MLIDGDTVFVIEKCSHEKSLYGKRFSTEKGVLAEIVFVSKSTSCHQTEILIQTLQCMVTKYMTAMCCSFKIHSYVYVHTLLSVDFLVR